MTEGDLIRMLGERYAAPAFAFLPHVRNGTGYRRKTVRTADGLAMSLYPSRGLHLHGFEVKVSRADWYNELHDPDKADEIGARCDFWWLVTANESIVQEGELPTGWGWLVPKNDKLMQKAEPKIIEHAKPLDRLFLAAILRRTQECIGPAADIANAIAKAKAEWEDDHKQKRLWEVEHAQTELRDLKELIAKFEEASGVVVGNRWATEKIGKAVRLVLNGGEADARERLEHMRDYAERVARDSQRALDGLATAEVQRVFGVEADEEAEEAV